MEYEKIHEYFKKGQYEDITALADQMDTNQKL